MDPEMEWPVGFRCWSRATLERLKRLQITEEPMPPSRRDLAEYARRWVVGHLGCTACAAHWTGVLQLDERGCLRLGPWECDCGAWQGWVHHLAE